MAGSYTVTIQWQNLSGSGKKAFDYLTTYNRTESTSNDPCSDVSPSCGTMTTFPVPTDPELTAAGVTPPAGQLLTMWGGTITQLSAYSYPSSDRTQISITFTASTANPVLAWGVHIAERRQWHPLDIAATDLIGVPYHTTMLNFNGPLSDLGVSVTALRLNSSIRIVEQSTPESAQEFTFSATGTGVTGFQLVDDGADNDSTPNSRSFEKLLAPFEPGTFGFTNTGSDIFDLTGISCSVSPGGTSQTSTDVPSRFVSIGLEYGDTVTCTFSHSTSTNGVCPQSADYWRANTNGWPVSSLMLGSQTYSQSELVKLLNKRAGEGRNADASVILAQELIAAKLNAANGADASSIASVVADADFLLSSYPRKLPYRVKTSTIDGQLMLAAAALLNDYNTGGCP